jgi:hypothetical protein
MVPKYRQAFCERQQHRALVVANSARLLAAHAPDLIFDLCDCRETIIPSAFELARGQAVIGINDVVLPARMCPWRRKVPSLQAPAWYHRSEMAIHAPQRSDHTAL